MNWVLAQGQTRDHGCHWPGCKRQVPPQQAALPGLAIPANKEDRADGHQE